MARPGIMVGIAVGLLVSGSVSAAAQTSCGSLTQHRHDIDPSFGRDYYVYAPCDLPSVPVPLIVYLHGCNQTAPEAATQTRFASLADQHKFIVVYPEQFDPRDDDLDGHLFDGNGAKCWNWFRPENWSRGSGEPAAIAAITEAVMEANIDPDRVYLMGTSAGGVMAATMGATYPDLYAAISINAGCGYPACADPSGALAAAAMGESARMMPVIVFHGTADEAAAFPMGVDAVSQWLGTNDIVDDGTANGSVSRLPASVEHHGLDETAAGGLGTIGDVCVGNRTGSPCLGGALGFPEEYPYSIAHYVDRERRPLLDFWIIHFLTHNYVSGDPGVAWSDPLGPDITQAAYDFFMAHPKDGGG